MILWHMDMKMPDPAFLFVYGTLRPGGGAPIAMPFGLTYAGPARTSGWLYRVADYPGMVADPAGGPVVGDLYAIADASVMDAIDIYEECGPDDPPPHEYARVAIIAEGNDGPVRAWTYVYIRDTSALERISGGDFLDGRR